MQKVQEDDMRTERRKTNVPLSSPAVAALERISATWSLSHEAVAQTLIADYNAHQAIVDEELRSAGRRNTRTRHRNLGGLKPRA